MPEMIKVRDYDILIKLVELNTLIYVRPLNEWQILELGVFEIGNFSIIMSIISPVGSDRAIFKCLNDR